jgi:hypothetical protein
VAVPPPTPQTQVTVLKLVGTVSEMVAVLTLDGPALLTVRRNCTVVLSGTTEASVVANAPDTPCRCVLVICRSALSGTRSAAQP